MDVSSISCGCETEALLPGMDHVSDQKRPSTNIQHGGSRHIGFEKQRDGVAEIWCIGA